MFPSPARLAGAVERAGVPATAATVRMLAQHVAACPRGALARFTGFDDWTAAYLAMRVLGEPDAFPADATLRRATGDRTAADLARRAERWRPWRAYAALLLWQH